MLVGASFRMIDVAVVVLRRVCFELCAQYVVLFSGSVDCLRLVRSELGVRGQRKTSRNLVYLWSRSFDAGSHLVPNVSFQLPGYLSCN